MSKRSSAHTGIDSQSSPVVAYTGPNCNALLRPGPPTFQPEARAAAHILRLAQEGFNFLTLRDFAEHPRFGALLLLTNPHQDNIKIVTARGLPDTVNCMTFDSKIAPVVASRESGPMKFDDENRNFVVPLDAGTFASNLTMVPCLHHMEDKAFFLPRTESIKLDMELQDKLDLCIKMSYEQVVELLRSNFVSDGRTHQVYQSLVE